MKDISELAESKLILLYMIHKMNLPVFLSYVQQFALEAEYMDYFSLSTYLAELSKNEYLLKNIENNKTSYTISEKGVNVLNYFSNRIPSYIKEKIDNYVLANRKKVRRELEVTAVYYENESNNYIVKCGAYEDSVLLMEVNLNVVSKESAERICKNWKDNVNTYYLSFLKSLLNDENKPDFQKPSND